MAGVEFLNGLEKIEKTGPVCGACTQVLPEYLGHSVDEVLCFLALQERPQFVGGTPDANQPWLISHGSPNRPALKQPALSDHW